MNSAAFLRASRKQTFFCKNVLKTLCNFFCLPFSRERQFFEMRKILMLNGSASQLWFWYLEPFEETERKFPLACKTLLDLSLYPIFPEKISHKMGVKRHKKTVGEACISETRKDLFRRLLLWKNKKNNFAGWWSSQTEKNSFSLPRNPLGRDESSRRKRK